MSKKMKIPIVMIFTILIAGCGSATEADKRSEEWKTFTNEQFGYSFEVPTFFLKDLSLVIANNHHLRNDLKNAYVLSMERIRNL